MKKIVTKLNKNIRKQISANFIKDRFKSEFSILNHDMDIISQKILNKIYSLYSKDDIDIYISECLKAGIYTNLDSNYHRGVVVKSFKDNNSLIHFPLSFYEKNKISYEFTEDYSCLVNINKSNNNVCFIYLNVTHKYSNEVYELKNKISDVSERARELDFKCYELLSKTRTVENLLQQWSEAFKYLPKDIKVIEPEKLTLSERFALL